MQISIRPCFSIAELVSYSPSASNSADLRHIRLWVCGFVLLRRDLLAYPTSQFSSLELKVVQLEHELWLYLHICRIPKRCGLEWVICTGHGQVLMQLPILVDSWTFLYVMTARSRSLSQQMFIFIALESALEKEC
jgi:hypothetical protein